VIFPRTNSSEFSKDIDCRPVNIPILEVPYVRYWDKSCRFSKTMFGTGRAISQKHKFRVAV